MGPDACGVGLSSLAEDGSRRADRDGSAVIVSQYPVLALAGDGARSDGDVAVARCALRFDPVGAAGDGCGVHIDCRAALRADAGFDSARHQTCGANEDRLAGFAPDAELAARNRSGGDVDRAVVGFGPDAGGVGPGSIAADGSRRHDRDVALCVFRVNPVPFRAGDVGRSDGDAAAARAVRRDSVGLALDVAARGDRRSSGAFSHDADGSAAGHRRGGDGNRLAAAFALGVDAGAAPDRRDCRNADISAFAGGLDSLGDAGDGAARIDADEAGPSAIAFGEDADGPGARCGNGASSGPDRDVPFVRDLGARVDAMA